MIDDGSARRQLKETLYQSLGAVSQDILLCRRIQEPIPAITDSPLCPPCISQEKYGCQGECEARTKADAKEKLAECPPSSDADSRS